MSDATQTPWAVHLPSQGDGGAGPHDRVIVGNICEPLDGDDEGGTCVVVAHVKGNPTAGGIPAANAELIVRAVNSFAGLLAACKRADALMSHLMKTVDWGKTFDLDVFELNGVLIDLPAAIAKATG